jgi:23S rRNA-/tRNA-specific pseudouridylate synthase
VASKKGRSLVRVRLHTGRKHQIRVHLSERGCPIVGDRVYGKRKDDEPFNSRRSNWRSIIRDGEALVVPHRSVCDAGG